MLFRKKIPACCQYCTKSTALGNGLNLCAKKGPRKDTDSCGSFEYDPCKRIPGKTVLPDFSKYDQEDFSL